MEKIKELWRKWDKINQLCQRKCEFYSTWERNQAQYDYWSEKLFYSGKMLFRIEQMYGLVVHYSVFGRLSWV